VAVHRILLEVVQETFVLAIFFFVGKGLQKPEGPGPAIRTAFTSILMFSIVLAAALFFVSDSFVSIIGTPDNIQAVTSQFLKIKTATIPLFLLSAASVIIVETVNKKKYLLTIAILQVVYQFIFDSLFYGGYPFSLNLGVLGVAWADIASGTCLFITTLIMLRKTIFDKVKNAVSFFTLKDVRSYLKVGGWSGLDSLVRNVAYFFLIVRLLNLRGRFNCGYYLAMHIFWSFLLVGSGSCRKCPGAHCQPFR
jgi:Na+-driven multidrug efflux pump